MEENRKYLGTEKTNLMQFQFKIHTQDCNGKCIYWLLKKKKRKSICLQILKKQIPRLQAGLLGWESLEFCTLNTFPWGYQQTLNFGVSSLKTTKGPGISSSLTAMGKLINKLVWQDFHSYLLFGRSEWGLWVSRRRQGTGEGILQPWIKCSCSLSVHYWPHHQAISSQLLPQTHPKGYSDLSWYPLATKFPSSKLNRWRGFSYQMWAWLGASRKKRLSSEEPRKTHTAQGHCHQIAMESRCGPFQPNPAALSATCPDNRRQNSLQWWSSAARGPGSWWPTGNALHQLFLTLQAPSPPYQFTNHYGGKFHARAQHTSGFPPCLSLRSQQTEKSWFFFLSLPINTFEVIFNNLDAVTESFPGPSLFQSLCFAEGQKEACPRAVRITMRSFGSFLYKGLLPSGLLQHLLPEPLSSC